MNPRYPTTAKYRRHNRPLWERGRPVMLGLLALGGVSMIWNVIAWGFGGGDGGGDLPPAPASVQVAAPLAATPYEPPRALRVVQPAQAMQQAAPVEEVKPTRPAMPVITTINLPIASPSPAARALAAPVKPGVAAPVVPAPAVATPEVPLAPVELPPPTPPLMQVEAVPPPEQPQVTDVELSFYHDLREHRVQLPVEDAKGQNVGWKSITAPVAVPPSALLPAPATVKPGVEKFVVQLAAFPSAESANALAQRLRGAGAVVSLLPVQVAGATLYRLRMGPYPTRAEADNAAQRWGGMAGTSGMVMREITIKN